MIPQDAGVIRVVALTDPLQLGFRRQAMVGIQADGDLPAVADALAELPECAYVVLTEASSASDHESSAASSAGCCIVLG